MDLDALNGPWSLIELTIHAHLTDEEACINWCIRVGILPRRTGCRIPRLPLALHNRVDRDYWTWKCPKSGCSPIPIARGTLFEGTHISMGKMLSLAWCFAYDCGYEQTQLQCMFNPTDQRLSSRTIADWNEDFRQMIIARYERLNQDGDKIGGPGVIVQIDEAKFGWMKYNRGRHVEGQWVLGMIDQRGLLRLEIVAKRDKETLHAVIQRHVAVGSIIHTDEWRSYSGLEEHGYEHDTVCHKMEFVAANGTHTQKIESQWRAIRRKFNSGGVPREDLADHLLEYIWRRQCKIDQKCPFGQLMQIIGGN